MINPIEVSSHSLTSENILSSLPELAELKLVPEKNAWHEETTYEHITAIMQSLEAWFDSLDNETLRAHLESPVEDNKRIDLLKIVVLLHDVGKKDTIVKSGDGTTSFPGHEEASTKLAPPLLEHFDITEREKVYVLSLIKNHAVPHHLLDDDDPIKTADKARHDFIEIFYELIVFGMLDTMGSKLRLKNPKEFARRMAGYEKILSQ